MERDNLYVSASRVLGVLLTVAVVVSVVHYVDNYVNYADYPVPDADSGIPVPSAALVVIGWFLFTASGALGVWLWRRRRITAASFALMGYAVSGLIGFGHYAAPGAFDMVWWRQAHVATDIVCGIAVAAFAVWAARHASDLAPAPAVART